MDEDLLRETLRLVGKVEQEKAATGVVDFEAKRNTDNIDLFEQVLREVHGDIETIVTGHHIMFMRTGHPLPFEIPSADALIFNHDVAKVIWKDEFKERLAQLAHEPAASRDRLFRELYNGRGDR